MMPVGDTGSAGRATRRAVVALLVASCAGCGDSPGAVTVDGTRVHPPLLLSELRAAKNPQELLQTGFTFVNGTGREAIVRFDGAGCVCYDVAGPTGALNRGESVSIPAGQSWPVSLGVAAPTSTGEREFNAQFAWVRAAGEATPLPLSLTLSVFADVAAAPDVLTIGYRPGEPTMAERLEVVRTARDRATAAAPPRTLGKPDIVSVSDWRPVNIQQLPNGLWRGGWESAVNVALPDDCRDEFSGTISVSAGDGIPPVTVSVRVRPRVGIRGPGRIQLGLLTPGTPRRRRVLLSAADGLPFRIVSIAPGDPRVSGESLTPDAAARHWLMLEAVLPDAAPLEAVLVCRTDHPDAPMVELQVTGRAAVDNTAATGGVIVTPAAQDLP